MKDIRELDIEKFGRHMEVVESIEKIVRTEQDALSALTASLSELYQAGFGFDEVTKVVRESWRIMEQMEDYPGYVQ